MATIDLNLVRYVVAVHEAGSFSAAGARLGVPRSTVSRAVSALEDQLGISLFQRTTRQVVTTVAGITLIDRVRPGLTSLDHALRELPEPDEAPSGTLRIATLQDVGTVLLAELLARFAGRYPQVKIEVRVGMELIDLVAERFDLALRIYQGTPRDSSQIARKVGSVALMLCASPGYLARKGTPRSAGDLAGHDRIDFADAVRWPSDPKRKHAEAPLIGCNDPFFARSVVRAGGGIAALPGFLIAQDLADGSLVRVLPRWALAVGGIFIVYPTRKHVPRRVTAFQQLAVEHFRASPLVRAS